MPARGAGSGLAAYSRGLDEGGPGLWLFLGVEGLMAGVQSLQAAEDAAEGGVRARSPGAFLAERLVCPRLRASSPSGLRSERRIGEEPSRSEGTH